MQLDLSEAARLIRQRAAQVLRRTRQLQQRQPQRRVLTYVPPPPGNLMDLARRGVECGTRCPRCGGMVAVGPDGYEPHRTGFPFAAERSECPVVGDGLRLVSRER